MGTAGRSFVRTKNFDFTQQIEKFSWRLRRGAYESPKYYCESTGCNWTLVIEQKRGSFFRIPTDYIEMSLKREDCEIENQYISVRLIVKDAFNAYPCCASKEIDFTPSCNKDIVLRMEKIFLFGGYFGLNKWRFVPNDVLSVKCEITIHENVEENSANENELENKVKYLKKEKKIHYFAILLFRCLLHLLQLVIIVLFLFFAIAVSIASIAFFVHICIMACDFLKRTPRFEFQDAVALFGFSAGFLILCFILAFVISAMKTSWYFVKPGDDRAYYKLENQSINKLKC